MTGRPLTARRARAYAAGALAVLLTTGPLTGCSSDADADELDPHLASTTELEGWEGFVQLPHGQVRFTVGEATDGGGDGGRGVPVVWRFRPGAGVPADHARLVQDVTDTTTLTVQVGERRRALGTLAPTEEETRDGALVPVGEFAGADAMVLAVDFDGVTQQLEVGTGRRVEDEAAPLYAVEDRDPVRMRCRIAPTPSTLKARTSCRATATALPWVAGLGWAGHRRSWWVVDLDTSATGITDRAGTRYQARTMTDASTVGGDAAALVVGDSFGLAEGQLRTLRVHLASATRAPSVRIQREVDWYDGTPARGLRDPARQDPALTAGQRMRVVGTAVPVG